MQKLALLAFLRKWYNASTERVQIIMLVLAAVVLLALLFMDYGPFIYGVLVGE